MVECVCAPFRGEIIFNGWHSVHGRSSFFSVAGHLSHREGPFRGGGPKIGSYIHEKKSTNAAHEKWNGRKAVNLHRAPQLGSGLAVGLSPLTSLCQTGTSLAFGDAFCFLRLRKSTNLISVSTHQLPWILGDKCCRSLFCVRAVCPHVPNWAQSYIFTTEISFICKLTFYKLFKLWF